MKRILAFALAIMFVVSALSVFAFAEKDENETEVIIYDPGSEQTVIVGDVDRSGEVDADDRMMLARYLAHWGGIYDEIDMEAADVDGSGEVDADDRMILARYLAHWGGVYDTYFADNPS